eukprot:6985956-Prymnesium_polylepis.1
MRQLRSTQTGRWLFVVVPVGATISVILLRRCPCGGDDFSYTATAVAPRDRKERENEWICGSEASKLGSTTPPQGVRGGVSAPPVRAQLPLSEGQRVASEAGLRPGQTAQLPQRGPSEAARCALNYAQSPPPLSITPHSGTAGPSPGTTPPPPTDGVPDKRHGVRAHTTGSQNPRSGTAGSSPGTPS